jgi:hypothetical protein
MISPTLKHAESGIDRPESAPFSVFVLQTRPALCKAAIRKARELSRDLRARVVVVAAQVVPYPRDVQDPPVASDFSEARVRRETGIVEDIMILLCRDPEQAFVETLPKGSLVVLGARKRWWKTAEDSLAKRLRDAGHQVVVAYA